MHGRIERINVAQLAFSLAELLAQLVRGDCVRLAGVHKRHNTFRGLLPSCVVHHNLGTCESIVTGTFWGVCSCHGLLLLVKALVDQGRAGTCIDR